MKTRILSVITGIIIIPFALIVGGRIPYFLLYIYLLTWIIPLIHCLMGLIYLKGEIKIPEKEIITGEEINIRYEILNTSPFSFARLEVENSIAIKLTGKQEKTKILSLNPKENIWTETVVECRRRGIYEVGEVKVYIKDIFNLFSLYKTIRTPIALKIYPQITPLKNISVDKSQDYYSLSDLREYQEGDPLKKIHWKASAKRDTLMVKNYEEWGEEEVIIILDSAIKSYREDENQWLEDKAVETTLSIANHFLENNVAVTLYYQKAGNTVELTGDHYGYLKLFMEELVDFRPRATGDFNQHIGDVSSKIKPGSMLYIVTPLLDKKLGVQGIRLNMKNKLRYIVLGDKERNPVAWQENKNIGKILEGEGITTHIIDQKQDIRNAMEEGYAHGA